MIANASRSAMSRSEPVTLARYENGHCEPLSSLLALLCEDFGLNPSWLLIGDNTPMFITGTETATFRRAAS